MAVMAHFPSLPPTTADTELIIGGNLAGSHCSHFYESPPAPRHPESSHSVPPCPDHNCNTAAPPAAPSTALSPQMPLRQMAGHPKQATQQTHLS